jgi:hypothetical protein
MNFNGYINSVPSLNSILVLLAENWGVSISSPRLIHALSRNGMDFELLTDFFESHGYPHNFFTIRRKQKQQLVIINARFDALKQDLLPFLRGHAAA